MKRRSHDSTTEVKEYLMSLIGNAPYGILALDLEGTVTIANVLAAEYLDLGSSVNALIDRPAPELISGIPSFAETIERCISQGRGPFDLQDISCGDRYLTIRGRLILNGLLITIEDVSERIRGEQKLKEQAQKLERSLRELEEFAYISAHDMKSPIASLDGIITLMEKKDAVKSEHKALFEMAQSSSRQMRRTITALNEIIAFRKTLGITKKKLKFAAVLEEVQTSIAELIRSSGARIRADFSKCAFVEYPPAHLRSILQNLLTNAIKYSKPGKPPHVEILTKREKAFVVLQVSDRGLGIDLERYGSKLYGLFQRFHTHAEGMGIGLHMVHSIVESYGGKILADSKPGRGTTFKIYLANVE